MASQRLMEGIEEYTHRMNILYWSGAFSWGMRGGDCVIGDVYSKQTVETVIDEGRTQQISRAFRIMKGFVGLEVGGVSSQDVVVAAGLANARDACRIRHAIV